MFHNIPIELRLAPRWCFTGVDNGNEDAKIPHYYNETKGYFEKLSVHDYHLCLTFEELQPILERNPGRGFGFMLVDGDGFTCVDLDVKEHASVDATLRSTQLVEGLNTYTEVSRSGEGLHLWLRGEINGAIKTNEIEVYSRERFIICTGNVFRDLPIANDPSVIEFFNEHAKETEETYNFVDTPQTKTDEQIMAAAFESDHSGKLSCLMVGDWDTYCRIMRQQTGGEFTFDASQADAAFMGIITYYTRNIEQCKRLWRSSALADVTKRYPGDFAAQRKKAEILGRIISYCALLATLYKRTTVTLCNVKHSQKKPKQLARRLLNKLNMLLRVRPRSLQVRLNLFPVSWIFLRV